MCCTYYISSVDHVRLKEYNNCCCAICILIVVFSLYCFAAELLVDKAMALRTIGGVFGGNIKPTAFICLVLKMLQIQPEKDIIIEFIKQDEFK